MIAPALCSFGLPAVVVLNSHYSATSFPNSPANAKRFATWAGHIDRPHPPRGVTTGLVHTGRVIPVGRLPVFALGRTTAIAPWGPLPRLIGNDVLNGTSAPSEARVEPWPCSLIHRWLWRYRYQLGLHTCWKPIARHAPIWGNWLVLLILAYCAPDGQIGSPAGANDIPTTPFHLMPYDTTHLPPIMAGGGLQRSVAHRRDILQLHKDGSGAVALHPWGKWYGAEAGNLNQRFIESAIGGPLADSPRKNYKRSFQHGH